MAPAEDYLYLSIQTFINTISLLIVIPCLSTLVRTQGIHGNCKVILVTSGSVQALILCVQSALFAYNYIVGNLVPLPNEKMKNFEMVQNTLFTMSSYLSLAQVLERAHAVRHPAEYERSRMCLIPLLLLIGGCLIMGLLHVYMIFWHGWYYQTIAVLYALEASTLIISIVLIIYSRRKIRTIPFDDDRLKAMYQVKEVLSFSMAILPSVMVSSVLHTLSLVPTLLWINGVIDYPLDCLFYFSTHSINCMLTKFTLIVCHKGMRQRFQLLFVKSLMTPKDAKIKRDTEKEGKEYFDQMRVAWDSAPSTEGKGRPIPKVATRKITLTSISVAL